MYLINWNIANLLMIFTTLCLIGIPAIILIISFRKYKGIEADKEGYLKNQSPE